MKRDVSRERKESGGKERVTRRRAREGEMIHGGS
jgi:hypothetical protein